MADKVADDVLLWAVRSVSGEVTPNMRMIAFAFAGETAKFRFYMSQEPQEFEKEISEIVAVNFDSGIGTHLKQLDIEFVVTPDPLGKLDTMDFCLFRRWEPV